LLHLDRFARLQLVVFDEPQERLVLIDHPRHGHGRVERAGQQVFRFLRLHLSLRVRNRVAMRIHLGPPEHLVHPIDETVADDVFELFGFVVHFVPRVAHHPDEKQLDQAMTTKDEGGELFAGWRQGDTGVRLVFHQPGFSQRLHHRRCRSRRHAQRCSQLPHWQQAFGGGERGSSQVNRFQVVLDGAGREHWMFASTNLPFGLC
jgi:hypothetical protein